MDAGGTWNEKVPSGSDDVAPFTVSPAIAMIDTPGRGRVPL